MTEPTNAALQQVYYAALEEARSAINSMKVEAETAGQGDEQMMLEACETISNEGLQADMAIRAALASAPRPVPSAAEAPAAAAGQCEDAIELLGKYKELCEEIKRGDSYHIGRIDAAISVLAQAAPQPAVQQGAPVAWRSWDSENSRWNFTLWPDEWAGHADVWEPLYTYPAAPVAQGDAEDAARYRWLAAHCRSTAEHWGGRWSIVVDGPAPKSHDSEDDFDAAIDAARKQGANHD